MLQWASTFPGEKPPSIEEVFGSKETFIDQLLEAMKVGKKKLPELGILHEELEKRRKEEEDRLNVTDSEGKTVKIKTESKDPNDTPSVAEVIILEIDAEASGSSHA